MKTAGIIAEYNPFHNGHKYQISEIKKRTGADTVVAVMSGDFVQRGTPAWTDKYLRTRMALSCGVDFVFELPVTFSCASAEYFAAAGVSLLTGLDFVDFICFGAECDDIQALQTIADFLTDCPKEANDKIKAKVKEGKSYPAARAESIREFFPALFQKNPILFSSPNNILATEYLKALKQKNSPLSPVMIKRMHADYHKTEITDANPFASSTAIRTCCETETKENFLLKIQKTIPDNVFQLLKNHNDRYPVHADDFSELLYYRLLNMTEEDLTLLDMNKELYNRIAHLSGKFNTFTGFAKTLKTKQYTYSRICRVLLHLLLNIPSCQTTEVPYARLLGFRKEKSSLLRSIKKIPLITKPSDGFAQLDETAKKLYEKDIFAANLYRKIQSIKQNESPGFGNFSSNEKPALENEILQKPVIL